MGLGCMIVWCVSELGCMIVWCVSGLEFEAVEFCDSQDRNENGPGRGDTERRTLMCLILAVVMKVLRLD